MIKTYKYRLLGSENNLVTLYRWIELCCVLYNCVLRQRIMLYEQNRYSISCFEQINQLPQLKKEFIEYNDVPSQTLQDVVERVDRAFKLFYNRFNKGRIKVGFPRYKSINRYRSFTLKKSGWVVNGKYLIINKIGKFKLRLSREIPKEIQTITLKYSTTDKWYVYFCCSSDKEDKLQKLDKSVALDVGIKSFLVDSEGNKVDNPLFIRQAESILRRKQRSLSRKKKGSNNRKDSRLLVAKCYEKITNQRLDFLHKLANKYIQNYGTIVVEDLKISNMVRNRHLSKAINDVSWSKFFELLSYKAEEAGRKVIKVNPRNTSQNCSQCGNKVEKTLADRVHNCPYCGLVMDRDENAARNILRLGQSLQPITYMVA